MNIEKPTFSTASSFTAKSLPTKIFSKFESFLNIAETSVTLLMSKFDKSRLVKEVQSINIPFILVTFSVSKDFIFNDVKLSDPSNILRISVTLLVSKFDKSNSVNLVSENMHIMLSTLLVSKLDKSNVVMLLTANIPSIVVTLLVSTFEKSIEVSFEHRKNITEESSLKMTFLLETCVLMLYVVPFHHPTTDPSLIEDKSSTVTSSGAFSSVNTT